ncbi:MAG TPA: hypothetical protein VG204_10050 [Terriglobia bacterium]|nr:hypothetical protein [Terriglobia bacterium]
MKRIRIASALLALVVLAALAIVTTTSKHTVRAVYASSGCTDATLSGNYAFSYSGHTSSQGPTTTTRGPVVPLAAVGLFAFDGAGNLSASFSVSSNGTIATGQTDSGTYSVNSDCTGSVSLTTSGFTGSIAIAGGGSEVLGMDTRATYTSTFDLKKQ